MDFLKCLICKCSLTIIGISYNGNLKVKCDNCGFNSNNLEKKSKYNPTVIYKK